MITLALGQVLWGIAFGWRSLTGGDDGLPSVPRPRLPLPWALTDGGPFNYFVLAFFAVDRKSTRLNSSHGYISYAVFCLKKKKKTVEILKSQRQLTRKEQES